MGCDIHMCVETKQSVNGSEKWLNSDAWMLNKYFGEEGEREYKVKGLCTDRNYELFSALANVRNDQGNPYICDPKGLPEDASPHTITEAESWGDDGHSHSYLTLAEIKEFSSQHKDVKRGGMVTPEQAKELDENGADPEMWCGSTNRPDAASREWVVAFTACDDLIEKMTRRMKDVFWLFRDDCDKGFEEKIRIVFWFDN